MDHGATTDAPAIEVRGLVARFGSVTALDGLDLCVPRGAFFGLLGPNGAGKTTTVHILATLLRPAAGQARLLGLDVVDRRAEVRARVGLVFQESSLDPDLTPREHLDFCGRLYHLSDRSRRVDEVLALAGLEAESDTPARRLSGGLKRRLEIARGILHQPRVLFLDEPSVGLDVAARAAIWEHLRALHAAGQTTLFLTTHYMEEADALCDELAIVDRGRLVAAGSPGRLKAALGGDVATLTLERTDGAEERLARVEGVQRVMCEVDGGSSPSRLRVTLVDGPRRLPSLLDAARPHGVLEVTLERPSLEHVYLHHTGHRYQA